MNTAEKAVFATRHVGMHLYGHLLGVWCEPPSSGHCSGEIKVNPNCLDHQGSLAIGALATLGDMALQTALLPAYPGQRLMTMLLQVRRYGLGTCDAVHIAAQVCNVGKQAGLAHAWLKDNKGSPIGDLCGTFVPVPMPSAWRPLPWEIGLKRPVYPENSAHAGFSDDEITQIKILNALLKDGKPQFSDLIKLGAPERDAGRWRLPWTPEMHLFNRGGEAQGGAICGALALASKVAAPEGAILFEHKVQFFRPAKHDVNITVEALHEGRRFTSAMSRMLDPENRLVALGWSQFTND